MFISECHKYSPDIFPDAPICLAFSLAGQDPLKLDDVLNMSSENAQKCSILKAKNNFLDWYKDKIIMGEFGDD